MASKKKRFLSILSLALVLGVFLSPVGAEGTLTVVSTQDPGSWDPVDTYLVAWAAVSTNIYDGLTYRGPDAKLVPGLAEKWENLDGGKRIRFSLRKNVIFHDGEPFNAEAVKFTFDRLLEGDGKNGPQRSNYAIIDKVVIVDANTVDFYLKDVDPVLLVKLAGYGAMIVPPKYIKEKGEEYFNTHPVGTGPFKFVSYDPKVSIKLEAFDKCWEGAPKLSKLEYRFISEPATAIAELQAGRVDMLFGANVPIGMIPTIKANPKLDVTSVPGPTVYSLRFNTKNGITKDLKVRKALIMAVDRDAIIKSILGGQATAISSFQGPLSFGFDPSMKVVPYNPKDAMALLKDAKVPAGAPVQIDIRAGNATFLEVSQAVASYLKQVGINATIKPYESNYFLNDIVPPGKTGEMFQQAWGGWTLDFDNTAYLMYHTGEKWNPYDSDPKLDAMLESQRSISDRAKREDILQSIAQYTADNALEMLLYNQNEIFAFNTRVKHFVAPPDTRLRLSSVTVE